MLPTDEMRKCVLRHIGLWKTGSHAEWRACFTPGYTIEDPVGTGVRPMGSYETEWQNMHTAGLRLDMEPYRFVSGGREIVTDLRAVTHLGEAGVGPDLSAGTRNTLSYTGIYSIDDAGLFTSNRTFADPVPDHLWKAFYPTLPSPSERPPPPRSEAQIRQAIEDHLYFWNVGSRKAWRDRFSEDALIEHPVGRAPEPLADGGTVWDGGHGQARRTRRGCNRVIVCGMEALAQTIVVEEIDGNAPTTSAPIELFKFDADGYITHWRIFRDE